MADTWVEEIETPDNVDLVTDEDYKNVIKVNNVDSSSADRPGIYVENSNTGDNARALHAKGRVKIEPLSTFQQDLLLLANCRIEQADTSNSLKIFPGNDSENYVLITSNQARVLETVGGAKIGGTLQVIDTLTASDELQVTKDIWTKKRLLVGNDGGVSDGLIDAFKAGEEETNLKIGTDTEKTADVILSRTGKTTIAQGDLNVDGNLTAKGGYLILDDCVIKTDSTYLSIGTEGDNTYVQISKSTGVTVIEGTGIIKKTLYLGTESIDGEIDCNAPSESPRNLKLGFGSGTKNVHTKGLLVTADEGIQHFEVIDTTEPFPVVLMQVQSSGDVSISKSTGTTRIKGSAIVSEASEFEDSLKVLSQLTVGPSDGDAEIDSGGSAQIKQSLKIGFGSGTEDVHIKELIVGPPDNDGVIDSGGSSQNPQFLLIGGRNGTSLLFGMTGSEPCFRGRLQVDEGLTVGKQASNGYVDAGGHVMLDIDLKLGTRDKTEDVEIGRNGKTTTVKGDLEVDGEVDFNAGLNVDGAAALVGAVTTGDGNNDGTIDAASSSKDLKLGTDSNNTQNVEITRAGKYADIKGYLRLNSNELIMDGSASLSTGSGFVHDATGHGGGQSIDVIIGGNRVGYWDSLGYH